MRPPPPGRGTDATANQRRRLVWYLEAVVGLLVRYTAVYDVGMTVFEGRPVSVLHSVVVIETFTTTGYGEDAPWVSTQMQTLMVFMQLTGVFVLFLTLPLFAAPWVERRLATSVPASVDLEDHVVICEFSPRGEHLIEELRTWEKPFVIVERDRDRAETLRGRGLLIVHGNPESTGVLADCATAAADVVVADADDERNASIVLSAREVSDAVRVVAFAEEAEMADSLRYAGGRCRVHAALDPRRDAGAPGDDGLPG